MEDSDIYNNIENLILIDKIFNDDDKSSIVPDMRQWTIRENNKINEYVIF